MGRWLSSRFSALRKQASGLLSHVLSVHHLKTPRLSRLEVKFFGSTNIALSARKFKTNQARRSTRFKQYVYQLDLLSYREFVIAFPSSKARKPRARYAYAAPAAMLITGIIGSIFFGLHVYKPVNLNLSKPVSAASVSAPVQKSAKPQTLPHSEPMRISIPSINVDTDVVPTGLKADGTLDLPNRFDVTAWYTGGPAPGDLGPAVIAGHVDSTTGIAIFWRLREMVPGDTVLITRADGSTATFTVIGSEQYPQDSFPTQKVYGDIDYAGLRLITCGGTFSTQTGHYSDNTVVYARLVI